MFVLTSTVLGKSISMCSHLPLQCWVNRYRCVRTYLYSAGQIDVFVLTSTVLGKSISMCSHLPLQCWADRCGRPYLYSVGQIDVFVLTSTVLGKSISMCSRLPLQCWADRCSRPAVVVNVWNVFRLESHCRPGDASTVTNKKTWSILPWRFIT